MTGSCRVDDAMIDLLHTAAGTKPGGFAAVFRPVVEAWVVSTRPGWRCRICRELDRQGIHWTAYGWMRGEEWHEAGGAPPDVVITDGSAGALERFTTIGCEVIVVLP